AFHVNCRTRRLGLDVTTLPERFFINGVLAAQGKGPQHPAHFPFDIEHGYHFDSALLGRFLAQLAQSRGVQLVQASIRSAELSGLGDIAAVLGDGGLRIAGDLFVDCTGFHALLLQRQLGVPFHSFAGNLFGLARDSVQQLAVDGRRSPIWTGRSTERWFGRTAINLDDVKEAAHSLGGSVNDLFVTGALVAAAQVHSDAGSPVDELRVAIPVSHRGSASNGGNAFTPVHSLLPSGDMSVTDRFRLVHQRLDRVKREGSVALDGPAAAARLLPSAALSSIVGRTTGAIDFVCSNVRAAPFDLYIAGAHLDGNYPLGPLLNTSFNLTTMSYRGWLFLGLLADRAAVTDPDGLLAALDDAYTEVLAAGGVSRRRLPARHQPA
ncbi:MAG TPA: WS/DGAT domain-containing protein, partial [Microthrixaceae bacterium]|nr:WS/DGAT domain-containing protein [Microthrixaceae bacterium]